MGPPSCRISTDSPGFWQQKSIAVLVDPEGQCIKGIRPHVVIDAIMAKTRTSTHTDEAPLVIGIGPGFAAPENVHVVIESNRGHNLGKVIRKVSAELFTGTPGGHHGVHDGEGAFSG